MSRKRGNGKAVKDHLGREFPSIGEMLAHHGISPGTYYDRLGQGLSPQQAVAMSDGRCEPVRDHLGNAYPNKTAMAKAWGITYNTFNSRISRGYSLEQALTGGRKPVKDHLGNEYPDMTAMAEHYGHVRGTVEQRLKRGWDLADALAVPPGEPKPGTAPVKDHTGQEFPSANAMYAHWGTNKNTYLGRIRSGMTMQEALETKPCTGPKPCRDHLGNEFPSISAMCRHYGVSSKSFAGGLSSGKTLEQALKKTRTLRSECRDWAGRAYRSIKELAAAIHVSATNLSHYKTHGPAGMNRIAEAAVTNYWPGRPAGNYLVVACVEFPWFLCRNTGPSDKACPAGSEIILHADAVMALMGGTSGD